MAIKKFLNVSKKRMKKWNERGKSLDIDNINNRYKEGAEALFYDEENQFTLRRFSFKRVFSFVYLVAVLSPHMLYF